MENSAKQTKKCILVGCTGSVATIKLPLLVKLFLETPDIEIRVIVTEHAKHFYKPEDISDKVKVYFDEDEWTSWSGRGDPVLHIELTKWADILVIAPLDANTLAKIAQGMCDNLLTCVCRAWNMEKPLLFCPAMNTCMWQHPVTASHIVTLKTWGYFEVPCVSKTLMCGDIGLGAMAEITTIVQQVFTILNVTPNTAGCTSN